MSADNPDAIPHGVPDERINHVYPLNDLREHDIDRAGACWCRPAIEHEGWSYIVVHNALDGREAYERGIRKRH